MKYIKVKGMIKVKNQVTIIGGDMRIVNFANMMKSDGFKISTYALEKSTELEFDDKCSSLQEAISKSQIIISAVPLSKTGELVNAPYSDKQIAINDLIEILQNKKFIAGKIPERLKNNIECYDILENEEYAILNAIPSAEGAIQIAMEEYPKTISGSNILVMGFGRIGKILAKMLQGLGANVYCEARKNEDLAYIKAFGYKEIDLKDLDNYLNKFDIIFNNIPTKILGKHRLNLVKKDVLIIDLASNPGGVDFEYAKNNGIKTIWALGLPGKVAPISAAEYIKKVVYDIIKNIEINEREEI